MYYIGVNIGGTKCSACLGQSLSKGEMTLLCCSPPRATSEFSPERMLGQLAKDIAEMLQTQGLSAADTCGIGISCGGPLDSRKGVILSPPNLPGWDEIAVVAFFTRQFGVEAWLCNDANAGALAEWYYGAGRGRENLIFLTFGTGMGAGIIMDGRLLRGAGDMAGEVGHIWLNAFGPVGYRKMGSFEGFCSGGGIAQLAKMFLLEEIQAGKQPAMLAHTKLENVSAQTVGTAAAGGDPLALKIFDTVGGQLGAGLSILIDILNPELIVIGSIFARCQKFLWPAANEIILKETLKPAWQACQVVPALLDETIGEMAALSVAVYYSSK